jgi:hypothetical protein
MLSTTDTSPICLNAAIHAFVFNRFGYCEPASDARLFDCDEMNRRPVRTLLCMVGADPDAGAEIIVALAARRPWAQASVLARCGMITAAGGAIEVYASSQEAYDEFAGTVSGLAWWAERLGDPDPAAGASASVWCSTVLSQSGLDRDDPAIAIPLAAIAEVLVALGARGHA